MKHSDIIKTLQSHYNVLILYHPCEPAEKRVFIVHSFNPCQGLTNFLDLRGKEITELLDSAFFAQFTANKQTGISMQEFAESQFNTKLDSIPSLHYQFSPSYVWEWHLMS